MRLPLFSTALLLLTLMAASGSGLACSCITVPERENFKRADLVFEGEMVRVVPHKDYPQLPIGYTFRVDKILKGEQLTEVTLPRTTNCDPVFKLGSVYRVYAFRYGGKLTSSICSGNKLLRRKRRGKSAT